MPPLVVNIPALGNLIGAPPGALVDYVIAFAPAAAAVLLGIILVTVALRLLSRRYLLYRSFRNVVLMITVPKEAGEKGDASKRDKTTNEIRESISATEGIFKSIGSLPAQRGLKAMILGRDDNFSFEIVAQDGLVTFYASVPRESRDYVEQQIHANLPLAQIEEVADYNIFPVKGVILGTRLGFRRESYLPIINYKKLESDPLNALTNALAKVEKGEGAVIQLVVRSARHEWRNKGIKIASYMQQGNSFSQAKRKLEPIGMLLGSGHKSSHKEGEPPKEYRLSPLETEMVKSIEEKTGQVGIDVNINIVTAAPAAAHAKLHLDNIVNAFGQYTSPQFGNAFRKVASGKRVIDDLVFRTFHSGHAAVLTPDELASIYHLPLPSTETPNIRWLTARKSAPPPNLPEEGMTLGVIKYRRGEYPVRIAQPDRLRHMYIIGKSGTGKSEFLKQMMKQDIEAGRGICAIDPHGELAQDAIKLVPKSRADDVIYFNPSDYERPMGLNMLEYDPKYPEQKVFVVNEMLKIFDKLYDLKATGGPMFEYYMRNALLLIMENPESGSTLLEVPRVLADERYRAYKLSKCRNQAVRDFWIKEAQKAGGESSLANMVPYIASKLAPFITNDLMRSIVGQQKSSFNIREAMDSNKILLLDLAKGKLGDLNAYLIGMVLVGKILNAALSRQDMDRAARQDFFLYIDEFQNFITDSIATILSEARKYGLGLIVAHQYVSQLAPGGDTKIRDAVFGNAGTIVAFRVGAEDAEFLNKEFAPTFTPFDLINCEAATANVKLLIKNTSSRPFNMNLGPMVQSDNRYVEAIKQLSRLKYGRDRDIVEAEIAERTRLV
jgi:hypothetical protein